jgi:hypothetical protein
MHLEVLFKAGKLLMRTVGEPTIQGATVTGTQGMGVSTPQAAAVAEATVGLLGVLHMPKGGMLAIGAKSIMVAARGPPVITGIPLGMTMRELGVTPKLHIIMAPAQTCCPIVSLLMVYKWSTN